MHKSQVPLPKFFDRYIKQVQEEDLVQALESSLSDLNQLDLSQYKALGDQVYAPGKWTINDIFQHIADAERIMNYRALRFARHDETPLPGFEENDYAPAALANQRTLDEILDELKVIRQSSIMMFRSFTDDMLARKGTSNNNEITVAALGFVIAGHQAHHLHVIEERYLPLLTMADSGVQ